ncbi:MAG: thiol-disulfide isomerase/thioredoxin [Alphaproteobacteria bacterium]
MYKRKVIFTALLLLGFASSSFAATCLSYTSLGDSSCQAGVSVTTIDESTMLAEPEVGEVAPVAQKTAVAPEPQAPTLDDRIDEYMESYNKPPREFVAFNLDPTLENALKWAKKYREMMERNQKLTAAWGQAQTILSDMESKGQKVEGFQPMPEIPDYGAALPKGFGGLAGTLPSQRNDYSGISVNSNATQGAPTLGFGQGDLLANTPSTSGAGDVITKSSGNLFGESLTASREGPIEISYYFSAECPYCKKFEEGFKGLIKEFGSDLAVICVDMTPSSRTKANIHGKLDCSWRAAVPGEATAFGVQSTPTLLVNRGTGKGLEKIEGVVDMSKLKSFLLGGV